jgi:ribosomal protein L12E/L44/L45/RPP1/RPP2
MNPDYQVLFEGEDKVKSISTEKGSRILARLDKISPKTEDIYDDTFFNSLNICANALDNIKARVYMDQRCVRTHRPLVESGTLGSKGHVQVIVPKMTENYGQVQDANEEGSIPICTLKMFPEETIHCVEWAKDRFDSLFSQTVKSLQRVIEEYIAKKTLAKGVIEFKVIKEAFKMYKKKPTSLEDCLRYSRIVFQKYFHNKVKQLIYVYPLDHTTKEGKPFWSLPKRPPSALEFDIENKLHVGFVVSYARLMARVWGMDDKPLKTMDLTKALEGLEIPPFVPNDKKAKEMKKENDKQENKEEEENEQKEEEENKEQDEEKILKDFIGLLSKEKDIESISKKLTPEVFEKDEDTNGHIDFMFSCGNLRALNYKLEEMEWIKVKLKAGRIVPALATTTAAVSGLQTIEIMKILKGTELEGYRNCFMNTAINIISLSEPGPVVKHKIHEDLSVTVWDQWEYEIKETQMANFEDFEKYILDTYKLEIRDVLKGNQPVFMSALHKKEDFKDRKLDELLDLSVGEKCALNIICVKTGEEDLVENLPIVMVRFVKDK